MLINRTTGSASVVPELVYLQRSDARRSEPYTATSCRHVSVYQTAFA
jgi:hypothetical protein